MKLSDIIELCDQLDKAAIPMREQLVLHISRDDATELLIDLLDKNLIAGGGESWSFDGMDRMRAKHYIAGGIAYRMFRNNTMLNGMRVIAE